MESHTGLKLTTLRLRPADIKSQMLKLLGHPGALGLGFLSGSY